MHEWRVSVLAPAAPKSVFTAGAPPTTLADPVADAPQWVPPIAPVDINDDTAAPAWPASLASAEHDVATGEPRRFGEPMDGAAQVELQRAVVAEDAPHLADPPLPMFLTAGQNPYEESAQPNPDKPDGFAELIDAARRNNVQVEPERRSKAQVKRASNKALVVLLVVALIVALAVVERHNIIHLLPATAKFYLALGLK